MSDDYINDEYRHEYLKKVRKMKKKYPLETLYGIHLEIIREEFPLILDIEKAGYSEKEFYRQFKEDPEVALKLCLLDNRDDMIKAAYRFGFYYGKHQTIKEIKKLVIDELKDFQIELEESEDE